MWSSGWIGCLQPTCSGRAGCPGSNCRAGVTDRARCHGCGRGMGCCGSAHQTAARADATIRGAVVHLWRTRRRRKRTAIPPNGRQKLRAPRASSRTWRSSCGAPYQPSERSERPERQPFANIFAPRAPAHGRTLQDKHEPDVLAAGRRGARQPCPDDSACIGSHSHRAERQHSLRRGDRGSSGLPWTGSMHRRAPASLEVPSGPRRHDHPSAVRIRGAVRRVRPCHRRPACRPRPRPCDVVSGLLAGRTWGSCAGSGGIPGRSS